MIESVGAETLGHTSPIPSSVAPNRKFRGISSHTRRPVYCAPDLIMMWPITKAFCSRLLLVQLLHLPRLPFLFEIWSCQRFSSWGLLCRHQQVRCYHRLILGLFSNLFLKRSKVYWNVAVLHEMSSLGETSVHIMTTTTWMPEQSMRETR